MKIDRVNYPLDIAMVFVFALTLSFIINECGMLSMNKEQKLSKIEECTKSNYGVEYNYLMNNNVKSVGCCTKGQLFCNFDNLKSQR